MKKKYLGPLLLGGAIVTAILFFFEKKGPRKKESKKDRAMRIFKEKKLAAIASQGINDTCFSEFS